MLVESEIYLEKLNINHATGDFLGSGGKLLAIDTLGTPDQVLTSTGTDLEWTTPGASAFPFKKVLSMTRWARG